MAQSNLYFARERRKSLHDPSHKLKRTHQFDYDATGIVVDDSFPDRSEPVTFAITTKITAASPTGIVFELGSAIVGVAVWYAVADGKIYAAAGGSSPATGVETLWADGDVAYLDGDITFYNGEVGSNGITLAGSAPPVGQVTRIVFSIIPGSGKGRLWINGQLVAAGDGGGMLDGWSDDGNGAIGAVEGTVTTRVPLADRVTLANASIISPLNVFQNQRPRQFFEVA